MRYMVTPPEPVGTAVEAELLVALKTYHVSLDHYEIVFFTEG